MKENLGKTYNVMGIVKPGADSITLINSVKDTTSALSKNDIMVLCGGANDIAKNNSKEGLRHISNFVNNNTHTNIVMQVIPYIHDLVSWSCINKEVTVFNRKLLKIMKGHEHVTVTNYYLDKTVIHKTWYAFE